MSNQQIATAFDEIANLLELQGENPFRIRAYRRVAQNLESISQNLAEMKQEELMALPGIGIDLANKIQEYVSTGKIEILEKLRKKVPHGLLEIMRIQGVGPKTAKLFFEKLEIDSIEKLEKYAREKKLVGLFGVKEKTEENILRGIEMLKRNQARSPLGRVLPLAEKIVSELKKELSIKKIEIAGSLRRWQETVKDIDLLVVSDQPEKVMEVFVHLPDIERVLSHGVTRSSVILNQGLQVDLRVVEADCFGAAWQYFTGNKAHNIRLRELAIKKGLKINEYGVFRISSQKEGEKLGGEKEEEIYRALGLPFIPPELRNDIGEIEAALKNKLPNLITLADIKGDLHVHTDWSDGKYSIAEMAETASEKGYQYIVITDHTKSLRVAGGLQSEELEQQAEEIAELNKKFKNFKIFKGAEVDILSDGSLDLPDSTLKKLDFALASIHSGFQQSREQIMRRLISAMRSPYIKAIAHPTGRLLGEREGYAVDLPEILRVAKETNTALEINSYPLRLDLNDHWAREAKRLGVRLVVNTDAHAKSDFDTIRYGISVARRAWLEKEDVLNTLSLKEFEKFLNS